MKNQVLGLVMIVLLLIVGTNDSFAQSKEIQTKGKQEIVAQNKMDAKKSRHERQMTIWQKRLDLTNEQVATLESYLSEYMASVKEVKEDMNLSADEKKRMTKNLRKAYDAKFRDHLTEEQKAKFDSIRGNKQQIEGKKPSKGKIK